MTTKSDKSTNKEICWMFKRDLSTLSCHAAIEIDSLIINEGRGLEAVGELADTICDSLSPTEQNAKHSLFDPTTVVVMNRAIDDSGFLSGHLNSIDDLVKEANTISRKLKKVKSDYEQSQKQDIKKLEELRTFCLALSRQASSYQQSFYDNEFQHPYRS